MINVLIRSRFRAFFAALLKSGGKKKQHPAMLVLIVFALIYAAGAVIFMLYMLFDTLTVFFDLGAGWLYYAMGGTMALGLAVIGSVFTTQNQLYDAKDNELLLAMPIPPAAILFSRMAVLLILNLFFILLVMAPAEAVSLLHNGFAVRRLTGTAVSCIALTLLAQTLACIFGWLLHQLLTRIGNKAIASVIYMVLFFAVYIGIYSQANRILNRIMTDGAAIAGFVQKYLRPLAALGHACLGDRRCLLGFSAVSVLLFAAVCRILSATFVRTVTTKRSGKRRIWKEGEIRIRSRGQALCQKELRRFLSCPVYLTNQGLGILMMPAAAAAAFFFRGYVSSMIGLMEPFMTEGMLAGAVIVCIGFFLSMSCISAPSVSLEGNCLWILRSMPVSGKLILQSKLLFHIKATALSAAVSGVIAGAVLGCSAAELLLILIAAAELSVLSGLIGLLSNLLFPRFDWLNEVGPCKQSAAVMLTMILQLTVIAVPAVLYCMLLTDFLPAIWYLVVYLAVITIISLFLYRCLITWGARKMEGLDA